MTDPLDTLRPEVREARTDLYVHGHLMPKLQKSIGILDAELLRLAAIEADALIALDCEHDWQVEHKRAEKAEAELAEAQNTIAAQQGTMGALKRKLALAEGELAALKARIAKAPIVMPLYAGRVHSDVPMTLVVTSPVANEWEGKRVRLLVEE